MFSDSMAGSVGGGEGGGGGCGMAAVVVDVGAGFGASPRAVAVDVAVADALDVLGVSLRRREEDGVVVGGATLLRVGVAAAVELDSVVEISSNWWACCKEALAAADMTARVT